MHTTRFGPAILIRNFLSKDNRNTIFDYAVANVDRFVNSTVTSGDSFYRQSKVLYSFEPHQSFMIDKVRSVLPDVCDRLKIDRFNPSQVECQMTFSGNENYFRNHQDNSCPATASRVLSWVYYMRSNDPDGFTGGNISFYKSIDKNSLTDSLKVEDNSLLIFPSNTWHSVDPVYLAVDDPRFFRITCNGWVRK